MVILIIINSCYKDHGIMDSLEQYSITCVLDFFGRVYVLLIVVGAKMWFFPGIFFLLSPSMNA